MTATADGTTMAAAAVDARHAVRVFDNAREFLGSVALGPTQPLAAEVWVFDRSLSRVLLVKHRWRGWVPPGGKVECGETPRQAALRELFEETGVRAETHPFPAAIAVRSFHPAWSETVGFSYAAVVDRSVPLVAEAGQPAAWMPVAGGWASYFPEDPARIRWHAQWLTQC